MKSKIELIECATCKFSGSCGNNNGQRFCLSNPNQEEVVKYWLKYFPRKYSRYYYAKWIPFDNIQHPDEILPDSLFDI